MKSLIADMIKKKNAGVKANAEESKKLVGKNKSSLNQDNNKQTVVENKNVMRESKTLILD